MDKFFGVLQGKKTYITAGIGIITTLAAYLVGEIHGADALQNIWAAVLAIYIRKGIATDSK